MIHKEPRIPHLSTDLIEKLDELIPHKCPDRNMTPWDIAFYAGQRDLIDQLVAKLKLDERS